LGEAITGQATVDFASDADVTITLTDSATTQAARNLRLNITESSTGIGSVRNLILGSGCQIEKFYLINNTGTGAKTVKNTSGTGISVPAGKATLVFNNGTNVVDAASYFSSLTLGSALPVASGGTGLTAGTSGGILGYTATGTLASSVALTANALVLGAGAGATPTPMASLGTTTTVLHGNASGAPTFGAVSLTADVTGVLPTANGGTNLGGATPFTSGGVVYASSTSALATGSALTFDGTNLGFGGNLNSTLTSEFYLQSPNGNNFVGINQTSAYVRIAAGGAEVLNISNSATVFNVSAAEQMRLNSTGLGIGTSNPVAKLDVQATTGTFRLASSTGTNAAYLYATNTGGDFYFGRENSLGTTFGTSSAYSAVLYSAGAYPMVFFTSAAEKMRLDASGNLGIGTSSPTAFSDRSLTINGSTSSELHLTTGTTGSANGDGSSIGVTSASDLLLFNRENASIRFGTNNTDTMRLDASGNLGLGVTPSATNTSYKAQEIGFVGNGLIGFGANDFAMSSGAYYSSSGWKHSATNSLGASFYEQYNGQHIWYNKTAVSHTAGDAITFTQAMTLDASGNLGVGTSSPNTTLTIKTANDVGAQIFKTADTTSSVLGIYDSQAAANASYTLLGTDTTGAVTGFSSGGNFLSVSKNGTGTVRDLILHNYDAANIRFATNNTEQARITSAGSFLVGTTSAISAGRITVSYDANTYSGLTLSDSGNTNSGGYIVFNQGSTMIGSITRVGATSAVAYNTTSDYRLKTVTGAVTGQGARIDALKPIDYLWTESGQQSRGFLAHEFQTVYAKSVTGTKDAVDADGNPVYQAMQAGTAEVIADLVAEIQSLRQRLSAANL
jgi:hypothetical protein